MAPSKSLGTAGNHASVFQLGDNEPKKSCIVNSCLAYIHCHMSTRDKNFIKGKVISTFTLDQLKEARKAIFTYSEPTQEYGYRGPNGRNERSKLSDAFDSIYTKIVKLDANDNMPILALSSSDLLNLLTVNVQEHNECEKKFSEIDKDLNELKQTFHSFVSVVTSGKSMPQMPQSKSIPPMIRNRLLSTGSKRSASEVSDEDDDLQSPVTESENNGSDVFMLQRRQRQKLKRTKLSSPTKSKEAAPTLSYSNVAQKKTKEKPPSTWGKAKATTNFRGAVPDVFLYNCDYDVTEEDITEWCQLHDIKYRKIEKKSHAQARRSSYVLTLVTKESYDMILEGNILPDGIAARKFIPPRLKPEDKGKITHNQFREAINSSEVQKYLQEMDVVTNQNFSMSSEITQIPDANSSTSNS